MKLRQNQFYCVACRKSVTCKKDEMCVYKFRNGVYGLNCYCHRCGYEVYKFIKDKSVNSMSKKYGRC